MVTTPPCVSPRSTVVQRMLPQLPVNGLTRPLSPPVVAFSSLSFFLSHGQFTLVDCVHPPVSYIVMKTAWLTRAFRKCFVVFFIVLLCLSSTATASLQVKQFELGSFQTYNYESTVLLNEAKSSRTLSENCKDVGYQISAQLQVASVWQNPNESSEKILQMQLKSPELHIKSRKAPSPEGFVSHKSQLESMTNDVFLVHWNAGVVKGIYVGDKEERSMVNLKRGIASLFQFKTFDIESKEVDVSGTCDIQYRMSDSQTFLKTKTNCRKPTLAPQIAHPDKVLSASITSQREAKYTLNHDLSVLQSVETSELHEMVAAFRSEAGGSVQAIQEIKITDNPGNAKPVKADDIETTVVQIGYNLGITFVKQGLILEAEATVCQDDCPTFGTLVKENRAQLATSNLGTFKSALTYIKLLKIARAAKREEILKVLKNSKNHDILPQLLDIAAAAQTLAAHKAAVKILDLASEVEISLPERYFWSLSFGSHPPEMVIRDILNRSEAGVPSKKLSETLTLTVAAMTNKWLKLPGNMKKKLKDEVRDSIVRRLTECNTDEDCKQLYIRAARNLGLPELIPQLMDLVRTGNKRTGVAAMKALYGFHKKYWNDNVRDLSRRVFLQLGRRYDSSARTIAVDIVLELGPTSEELREIFESLKMAKTRDSQEVGQYTLQRLRQIAEKNPDLRAMITALLTADQGRLNGYHVLAQRGMATAFTRDFMVTPNSNGTLVSTLELAGGILKRSTLDITIEAAGESHTLFTLGMFAGGLSSFISSDDPAPEEEEEEAATAGMELIVLGVNIRPFIFFTGQGELMGHVWSGTGSDRTPAFQALMILQDHSHSIALQNGFVADISLLGTVSFELAGQITLSLWNRKANSVVEKNAGFALQGLIKVDSAFVRSHVEFTVATEPRLTLVSDVNFYNTVALCLQLQQPDTIVKHNIHKVERIPGSKHRLRKSKYKLYHVPGKTYALNRKNNEMCVKRLMREAFELREATDQYWAHPIEDNLFEWHFTVRGPSGTEFERGIYHGRIILPPEYPMKPPNIILLTPNGRFEINKKICLSISGHHPETWQPSWSIRTALLAIVAFMPTAGDGTIGSLDYTSEERKALARRSLSWSCPECGDIKLQLSSQSSASTSQELTSEENELLSQISLKGEEESQAAKWSNEDRNEEGLRQRSSVELSDTIEAEQLPAQLQEEAQGVSQGNTLILCLLVAIALLLYRRIFLLE